MPTTAFRSVVVEHCTRLLVTRMNSTFASPETLKRIATKSGFIPFAERPRSFVKVLGGGDVAAHGTRNIDVDQDVRSSRATRVARQAGKEIAVLQPDGGRSARIEDGRAVHPAPVESRRSGGHGVTARALDGKVVAAVHANGLVDSDMRHTARRTGHSDTYGAVVGRRVHSRLKRRGLIRGQARIVIEETPLRSEG